MSALLSTSEAVPDVYVGRVISVTTEDTPGKPLHVIKIQEADQSPRSLVFFGRIPPSQGATHAFVTAATPALVKGNPMIESITQPEASDIFSAMATALNTTPNQLPPQAKARVNALFKA